jgi:hypothetical protein
MTRVRALASGVVMALVVIAWVHHCSGPRPRVVESRLLPGGPPYRVDVAVRNDGAGSGEVAIQVELLGPDGGLYAGDDHVDLEPHATAHKVVDVRAPPGHYVPRVRLEYPER